MGSPTLSAAGLDGEDTASRAATWRVAAPRGRLLQAGCGRDADSDSVKSLSPWAGWRGHVEGGCSSGASAAGGVWAGRSLGLCQVAEPRALLSSWSCPLPGPDLLEPWEAPPPWSPQPPAPLFPGPYAAVSPDTRVGASPSLSRR